MLNNKLDITSTAIEKGIDLVKDFVEKLVGSTLEETGLLLGDKIRIFRLKNQIKMLSKAQSICKSNNISIKQISVKTLFPLLEYASLEDDENLQEKWANLLTNYVDSNKNLKSTIFPYILNQLSSEELEVIEKLITTKGTVIWGLKIDGIIKSNLIRLGIAEIVIKDNTRLQTKFEMKITAAFPKNHNIKITPLGIEFYNSCTRS